MPIASGTTRMSLKRMAASTPTMSTGCSVTSAASSGVLHRVRKDTFARTALYSGRYLPACLMNQTGVQSGCSPLHALRNRSALDMIGYVARPSTTKTQPLEPCSRLGAAGDLLEFEDGFAVLEDADGARGLGDADGDGAGL